MPVSEKRKKRMYKYAQENLKRIPLDVQKSMYTEIKTAADNAGETVNGYIKTAILMRMENHTPNAETLEAMAEAKRMRENGEGEHFTGPAEELFAKILAEED